MVKIITLSAWGKDLFIRNALGSIDSYINYYNNSHLKCGNYPTNLTINDDDYLRLTEGIQETNYTLIYRGIKILRKNQP